MKKLFLSIITIFILVACDKPETPPNNSVDLEHDEASTVELVFTPGAFATEPTTESIYASGFNIIKDIQPLTISWKEDHETGKFTLDKPEGLTFLPNQWYRVEINLYNHAGSNINHTILGSTDQVNAHQFYFRTFTGTENLMNQFTTYKYGDVDTQGKLLSTPVGFVGYISFSDGLPNDAQLNTILVHIVPPAIKTKAQGVPYPFYAPPQHLLRDVDVDFRFPVTLKK